MWSTRQLRTVFLVRTILPIFFPKKRRFRSGRLLDIQTDRLYIYRASKYNKTRTVYGPAPSCESVSDYRARKYNPIALPTYAPQRHEAPNRSRIYLYTCRQPWLESHHIIVYILDHLRVLCTSAKRRGGSIDCKVRS
jgi:hypothetical protein